MKSSALVLCLTLCSIISFAQTVPFPSPDPPRDGNLWPYGYSNVGTPASFNTSPFLPFWFNGLRMRVMPPSGVTYNSTTRTWNVANPNVKYPVILFFHGNGESGFDNNNQLKHGGQTHMQAVQSGAFPGFLVYPQDVTYDQGKQILEEMFTVLPVDLNRIYVHGLSGGGGKAWQFAIHYPTLTAGAFPMSATDAASMNPNFLYQPFRESQGSLDTNPSPTQSQGPVDYFNNNGGHLEYFVLPNVGHGTWNTMYARPDFFPWFLAQKKNKIFVRFDRNLICPEVPVSVDMGFTPGFDAYEWRKDGDPIVSATAYKYIATAYGSYTGRIKNRGVWSDWSDPVVVGVKATTNTPPITTNGLKSIVLPAPDGSTTTELALPEGYASYNWKNASNQTVSTARVFTNVGTGNYTASANEVNGCATIPSPVFKVISATGANGPDGVEDFLGFAPSQTSVTLSWADKPSPVNNETGFELYRSTVAGSSYKLVGLTGADITTFSDNNLLANTTYYYKIRPINATAAGPARETSVLTQVDAFAPTAPANLTATSTAPTAINLSWGLSTDNIGVSRYDIYKDGVKVLSLPSPATSATIYNLVPSTAYKFVVKARDAAGNNSTPSNLVTANSVLAGFSYQYYEVATGLTNLPNFSTITPVEVGTSGSLDITVRKRTTNYAFQWTGTITLPTTGNYTFVMNGARGDRLYVDNILVIDDNGNHTARDAEGTRNFAAGTYPVVVQTYANASAGSMAALAWKNTANGVGNTKTTIPLSFFTPSMPVVGTPPTPPNNLVATAAAFNQINLSWSDASNNENGFTIYRATATAGPFSPVGSVGANATSFQDIGLTGNTTYFYRVTAYGEFGESGLSTQVPRGFTCSYYEAPSMTSISQFANLVPKKIVSGVNFFDATTAIRERNENFGIKYVGKINILVAATYTFYASTDDGSTLLVDGTQVVSNDTDGNQHEKSGTKALTVGWHDIVVNWRKRTSSSSRITISYARPSVGKTAFSASNGNTWFVGPEVSAKTLVTPAAPLVATNVNISNVLPFSMKLNWLDNATNETSYQVLRSYKTNTSYVVYATIPSQSTFYVDDSLYANATYYYKVVAVGAGGQTASAEVGGTTSNNVPDLTAINDVSLKYGKTVDVNILSADSDNDPITLTVTGLPSFATFTNHGDGSGVIHFAPALANMGNYTISVTASDNHAGSETDPFVFTVTDKDVPTISPITNGSVSEGQTGSMFIGATSDFGTESLTWVFDGLPEFATYQIVNGVCTITLAPGYIHSGPYTVQVTVTDPLQASSSKTFQINVTDVDPNMKWSVNISAGSNGPTPWNNVTGLTASNLRNQLNATTGVGMAFQTTAWNTFNQGAVTGNNSGIFPDNVLREYYYFGIFGNPNTVDVKMSGLDITKKYTFNFLGSSVWNGVADNGNTVYKIGNVATALYVQNNSTQVATIGGVVPQSDGSITFTMMKAPDGATQVGYLNAFTLEQVYQDGTAPAAPRAVTASLVNSSVSLSWVDAPFNEDGFDVYRALSVDGPFERINESHLAKNSTSYADANVSDGVSYVYKVKAFNTFGQSDFSNAATFGIPNLAPKIIVSGGLTMSPGAFAMLNVSTTEDATLEIGGLPGFAFPSPVTASSTDVIFLPEAIHAGNYTFQAIAVDSTGLSTTQNITITVTEEVLYRVYLNFNTGALNTAAGSPWNNTNDNTPAAGDVYSNLKDDKNANTTLSVSLQTAPGGAYNAGPQTGNNSGMVPDAVLKEYLWFGIFNAPSSVTLKVSGLSTTNRYRFKFVSSSVFHDNGVTNNGSTVFTIGSKSTTISVENNTTQFGVISDVITNGAGEITIVASKGVNTPAGYINGMIIEALPIDVSKFNPSNLTAAGFSKTQVVLQWADNSPVETGYEIQRSTTGVDGSFSTLFTTARDINTYTDAVPVANQLYHYRVRAINGDGYSEFTNVARSSAVAFKILVNISIEPKGAESFDAPVPWNNIGRFGFTGDVFVGFKDDTGYPTGLRMRVQTQLESGNNWGPTTTNDSGVVPDKVLRAFWFNDAYFPQGEFVIDGLDQTFSYNFGFLGSIDVTNAVNTDFSINGKTVTNRNDKNIANVSYLRNVKPDGNSEILFTVKETSGSPWSIWNAMFIEGFATGGTANGRTNATARDDGNIYEVRYGEATNKMSFYPNPVGDVMYLKVEDSSYGNVSFEFYDLTGRVVQKGEMTNKTLNPEYMIGVDLTPAMYIMKVVYPDGRYETKRFIKN